jgi:hypothetical protein
MDLVQQNTMGFTWIKEIPPGGIKYGAPFVYTADGAIECPLRRGKPALPALPQTQEQQKHVKPKSVHHTVLDQEGAGQRFPCFSCGGVDHWSSSCPLRADINHSVLEENGVLPWVTMTDRSQRILAKALTKAFGHFEQPDAFWSSTASHPQPVSHNQEDIANGRKVIDVDLDANFNVLMIREVGVADETKDGSTGWCRRIRLFYEAEDVRAHRLPGAERNRVRFVNQIASEGICSLHEIPTVEAWKESIEKRKEVNMNEVVIPDPPGIAASEDEASADDAEEIEAKARRVLKHRRRNARKKMLQQVVERLVAKGVNAEQAKKHAHEILHIPMSGPCLTCGLTKQRRKAHSHKSGNVKERPRTWHVDTVGKIHPAGANGEQYVVSGVEEEHDYPFCRTTRSKLSREVKSVLAEQAKVFGFAPMTLRCGGDTEYQGKTKEWLESQTAEDGRAPSHELVLRYSPWRNGRAEKNNEDMIDAVSAIMEESRAPSAFWPLAVTYVNDVRPLVEGAVERLRGEAYAGAMLRNLVPFGTKATMVREGAEKDRRKFGHKVSSVQSCAVHNTVHVVKLSFIRSYSE